MRQSDKKELRQLRKELIILNGKFLSLLEQHQEWIDERSSENDYWENSPTGERAFEEQDSFEDWHDTLDGVIDEINDMLGDEAGT